MPDLSFNAGSVYFGGTKLPGVLESLSVKGSMIIDRQNVEGASGKKKVFSGYDDGDISVSLILMEPDSGSSLPGRYEALKVISGVFKALEGGLPVRYTLEAELAEALDITQVIFSSLDVSESKSKDTIKVTLSFEEWSPVVSGTQAQQNAASTPTDNNQGTPDPADAGITPEERRGLHV